MRRARFKLAGRFDQVEGATVTILHDGTDGLVSVRPLRRRRDYTLPLSTVARIIFERVVLAELRERRRARSSKIRR